MLEHLEKGRLEVAATGHVHVRRFFGDNVAPVQAEQVSIGLGAGLENVVHQTVHGGGPLVQRVVGEVVLLVQSDKILLWQGLRCGPH